MITKEQLILTFGTENVRTFAPDALRGASIQESTKAFLSKVGLPLRADLLLEFDFDSSTLPRLSEYATARGRKVLNHWTGLFRIGTDYGTQICISPDDNDAVICVDIDGNGLPDRFLNSSIDAFVESLLIYYRFKGTGKGMTQEQLGRLVVEERSALRSVDPRAHQNAENWWPLVLVQMSDGLL